LGTDEAVSVEEAVAMQTTAPAAAIRQEASTGRIAPGMLGDVVVLGDDPRTVPANEIPTIPVCATVVGGKIAFQDALS
jgi:predicted amidohydrolase YtcJ